MSFTTCAAHLYGVYVPEDYINKLCSEVSQKAKEECFDEDPNLYDVCDLVIQNGLDVISGNCEYGGVYLGIEATMPYETPKYTKEQIDDKIKGTLVFLFGEENAAGIEKPNCIYDVWIE